MSKLKSMEELFAGRHLDREVIMFARSLVSPMQVQPDPAAVNENALKAFIWICALLQNQN